MKTKYKHIYLTKIGRKTRTSIWECRTLQDGVLGEVKWYGPWRQYCFFPDGYTVFSAGCMDDINDFMRNLRAAERKEANNEEDE